MSRPYWITQGGDLPPVQELEFFSLPLEVYNPQGDPVAFTYLSGELPPGIQVVKSGILQGVPVVLDSTTTDELRRYRFTIRATCQTPQVVVDRTFSFTVSNIVPPAIIPDTPVLGEYFDGTLLNIPLQAIEYNPNAKLVWTLKDGELPPGVSLSSDGLLFGFIKQTIPTVYQDRLGYDAQPTQANVVINTSGSVYANFIDADLSGNDYGLVTVQPLGTSQTFEMFPYDYSAVPSISRNFTFTVQVYDGANYDTHDYTIRIIARSSWKTNSNDNTIDNDYITVDQDYRYLPVITTVTQTLPPVRQNSNFAFKFDAVDFYTSQLTWSSPVTNTAGNIANLVPGLTLDPLTGWLTGHVGIQTEYKKVYTFNVVAANVYTDGNTYSSLTKEFKLEVLGDTNNQITWTTPTLIGSVINGSKSELAVSAVNSLGKSLVYKVVHGYMGDATPATSGPPDSPATYQYVDYVNSNGDTVKVYSSTDYNTSTQNKMPQGLQLMPSGHIVGRSTFRHFQVDQDATTFDRNKTKFDNIFTVTILAETTDGTASSYKTFNIRVNDLYDKPYENLYLPIIPAADQRRLIKDIVNDPTIFGVGDELIYRYDDPNFGKIKDIEFLATPGVDPSSLADYANAIVNNHYNKTIEFGKIKTAIATDPDNNYAIKYEVVYFEIIDPFNTANDAVAMETNLYPHINPYLDKNGNSYYVIQPNTFDNMQSRVSAALGYSAQGVIPDWMTSVQADKTVLGFRRAVVLAYTKPGQAKKIAFRLYDKGINLNTLNFTIDRYRLDNNLSLHYDINAQKFESSRETTFDHIIQTGVYTFVYRGGAVNDTSLVLTGTDGLRPGMLITGTGFTSGQYIVQVNSSTTVTVSAPATTQPSGLITFTKQVIGVNYAVTTPFAEINNRTKDYIAAAGGIDNIPQYRDGDLLVFGKQESFNTSIPNDGWIYYNDLFYDGFTDPYSNGIWDQFDNNGFEDSYYVPGYLEKLADQKAPALLASIIPGQVFIFVPYAAGVNYIGNYVRYNGAIDYDTYITTQVADNSTGTLGWKLGLSKITVGSVVAGSIINIEPYAVVLSSTYNTITLNPSSLPAVPSSMRGKLLSGKGIPANTRVIEVIDNTVVVENPDQNPITIGAGNYLGLSVQNQRAGIWEVRVTTDSDIVRLEFIQEVGAGTILKVDSGLSFGQKYIQYEPGIEPGNTVPRYVEVGTQITFNGPGGARTSFDGYGTKFLDNRDSPSLVDPTINNWAANTAYPIGSIVVYNDRYYRAVTDVAAYSTFNTSISVKNGPRAVIVVPLWEKFEHISTNGDKYIKFPQLGVFN